MIHVIAKLLDELAHGIPNLHGAACRGHAELFDVADRHDHQGIAQAKALCASCPVLYGCRAWLVSLPKPVRPCGVVAGRYVAPPKLRPAYEPRPQALSSRARAADWLRAYLAQRGAVLSTEVIADATAVGISKTALHLARHDLGVRLERVRGVRGAPHTWM